MAESGKKRRVLKFANELGQSLEKPAFFDKNKPSTSIIKPTAPSNNAATFAPGRRPNTKTSAIKRSKTKKNVPDNDLMNINTNIPAASSSGKYQSPSTLGPSKGVVAVVSTKPSSSGSVKPSSLVPIPPSSSGSIKPSGSGPIPPSGSGPIPPSGSGPIPPSGSGPIPPAVPTPTKSKLSVSAKPFIFTKLSEHTGKIIQDLKNCITEYEDKTNNPIAGGKRNTRKFKTIKRQTKKRK